MDLTVDFFQVGDYSGLCGYAVDEYKEVQGWGEAPTIEGFRIAEFQNHNNIGPTFSQIMLTSDICKLYYYTNILALCQLPRNIIIINIM